MSDTHSRKLALAVGAQYSFTLRSDAEQPWLVGWVTWTKPAQIDPLKDVRVVVETPGLQYVFDNPKPSGTQTFVLYGPLAAGDYGITLFNDGQTDLKNVEVQASLG